MPFGLKNARSEFQNIMNDIFNPYSTFMIVYIDDVLVFSENIDKHFKHLEIFSKVVKRNGLVVSATKMKYQQISLNCDEERMDDTLNPVGQGYFE